jgi:hypothetical protein
MRPSETGTVLRRLLVLATGAVAVCVAAGQARAGTYYVYSCSSYGNTAPAFGSVTGGLNWNLPNECGVGRSLEINQFSTVAEGRSSAWVARSPSPAIAIVGAYTPVNAVFVDCTLGADGFNAAYRWSSGSERIAYINGCGSAGLGYANGIDRGFAPSSSFGWSVTCARADGCTSSAIGRRILGVQGVRLTAEENTGPYLDAVPASNIWYRSGWVRGPWPITLDASDPSGVCVLATAVDGVAVAKWEDSSRDTSRFTQCHDGVRKRLTHADLRRKQRCRRRVGAVEAALGGQRACDVKLGGADRRSIYRRDPVCAGVGVSWTQRGGGDPVLDRRLSA